MFDLRNKDVLKTFLGEIADENYFNDLQQVVRVRFNGRYFDLRYRPSPVLPNPQMHLAIITATEEEMNSPGIGEDLQKLMPGIADEEGNPRALPYGWVDVINRKQMTMVTNHQNASAPFALEGADMSNKNKTRVALTPPLQKDYTNAEGRPESSQTGETGYSKEDTGDQSIGVFINDDSIVIKSSGAQITMGRDGIHIGGKLKVQSSEHEREWMFDNTLSRFIPSTIPTGAIAIPELPNVAKFAKYGQTFQRIAQIADKTSTAISLFNRG